MNSETAIRAGTPLLEQGIRAVNFFNGRLVTSGDLARDQEARREGDARLGQAVGSGVVHGLEVHPYGDPADRRLTVKAGLAVNRAGQSLCLGADQLLALVPAPDDNPPATSGGFGACAQLSGGVYVAGDGLYLVTLAPAAQPEGQAPVLALEPGSLRCNSDVIVEAVQLRLLHIGAELLATHGLDTNAIAPPAVSKLRSKLAAACFGLPRRQAAHTNPGVAPGPDLLDDMRGRGLAQCDVPLAVVHLTSSAGIVFVDRWAVRRRVAASPAAPGWTTWLGEPMQARGEAQLAQFQDQLDDIPQGSLAGLQAAQWFAWLPPAGFLAASGSRPVAWRTFLGGRAPQRVVGLAPGDAPAVLAEALRRDGILLEAGDATSFRVYRIAGGPRLFVRNAPNARHAAEVWFDGEDVDMSQVEDVDAALRLLWARSCGQMVIHAGADPEQVRQRLASLAPDSDLMLCIETNTFVLPRPWVIDRLRHVTIRGHGAASLLRCDTHQAALVVTRCASLDVQSLGVEGGRPTASVGGGIGRGGALTVADVPEVRLGRVQARCSGNEKNLRAMAALVTHREKQGTAKRTVVVEDCVLEVSRGQQGLGCIHCDQVAVRGNLVRAIDPATPMLLGIVAAGELAGEVQVEGNIVLQAEQGIKVALSTGDEQTRRAEHVVLRHNRIEVAAGDGSRGTDNALCYGIGIGNALSVLVSGNYVKGMAKFPGRSGQPPGLHLHGEYGPRLLVLENHFLDFRFAVQLEPTGTIAKRNACLWQLELNLAERVVRFLEPPDVLNSVIERRRNIVVGE